MEDEDKGEFADNFRFYDVVIFVMSSVTALNHRNEGKAPNRDEAIVLLPCSELTSFVHRALREIMGDTDIIAACAREY